MGFLDALLGGRRKLKGPAPDRLFAMSTAYVTIETGLGLKLRGSAEETDTQVESSDDEFGYRWLILRDPDFEDLIVSLNTVSTQLQSGGYGDRLLACVFAFE